MTEWTESTNEKAYSYHNYDVQITLGWVTQSTVATETPAHRGYWVLVVHANFLGGLDT